jgi:Tfp pilus assembly protein PilF
MTSERGWKWPWILLAAVFVITAANIVSDKMKARQGPPDPLPAEVKPWFGPRNQAEALAAADNGVNNARARLASAPNEWLRLEMLGRALAARFRVNGSYADLQEANSLLAKGMANSEAPAGPSLSRATIAVLAHRLGEADDALKRFDSQKGDPTSDEQADGWAIKGDIAFQRGDTTRARLAYARAEEAESNASVALRQSLLELRSGDPLMARRRVNAVLRAEKLTRSAKAQAALLRTTIAYATGDWKAAGEWARFADGFFPGNPLAMAHVAQQKALEGDVAGAVRQYEAIVAKAPLPEVMDALAFTLRLQGRGNESRAWAEKAGAIWAERYRLMPEAAAAHLVEHELALGDPRRALPVAQRDAQGRPHGASLILLARVQLLTGNAKSALATLERAEKTGWRAAGLYLALADVHTALGDTDAADDAREEALDLNPKAGDPAARYIWFGHD